MAEISAPLVKELREATGISLLKCRQALMDANGDIEKARELLRKSGEKDAAKKADRTTGEGSIITKITNDGKHGVLIQLLCETDFVARGEDFQRLGAELSEFAIRESAEKTKSETTELVQAGIQKTGENICINNVVELTASGGIANYTHSNGKIGVLVALKSGSVDIGRDIAMQIAALNPRYLRPEDVPEAEVEKEKAVQAEMLAKEDKPAEMVEKILTGKLKKFREEQSLLKQAFVKDGSKTVEQFLKENSAEVEQFVRLAI